MRPLHTATQRKTAPAPTRARCDFCGRMSPIPDTWLPRPCPYCERLYFPLASRTRRVAAIIGLCALALLTILAWQIVF